MEVKFNDLVKQWDQIKDEVNPKIQEFFNSSAYICGPYLEKFETSFSKWTGRKYSIGVSNGSFLGAMLIHWLAYLWKKSWQFRH